MLMEMKDAMGIKYITIYNLIILIFLNSKLKNKKSGNQNWALNYTSSYGFFHFYNDIIFFLLLKHKILIFGRH